MNQTEIFLKFKLNGFDGKEYFVWVYHNNGEFIMDISDERNICLARKELNEEIVQKFPETFMGVQKSFAEKKDEKLMRKINKWKKDNKWWPERKF